MRESQGSSDSTLGAAGAAGHGGLHDAFGWRYEALELLGAGASGKVYRVSDKVQGGKIKAARLVCLASDDQGSDPWDRVRQEFLLGARFHHPNLVEYHDLHVAPERGLALLTMEFVKGGPLGPGLGCRDVATICEFLIQLLRGLQFMHECGLVHADVKPANALCCTSGGSHHTKLLDYHLASSSEQHALDLPRGTLRYMAPEVVRGRPPTPQSDLYSAGVLLWEALTGRQMFSGAPAEIAAQHLAARPDMSRASVAGKGLNLQQVLERLLAKQPEGRYESAVDAIAAVSDALGVPYVPETPETLQGRIKSTPLIGREHLVRRFHDALQPRDNSACRAKVFLIYGRPRMGKTRLLREFEVQAQLQGWSTLQVQGSTRTGELLEQLSRGLGGGHAARTRVTVEHAESRPEALLPDKPEKQTEKGRPGLSPATLRRLDHIAEALRTSSDRPAAIVFVDDVQLLPPEGLESLSFLVRAQADVRVLFCFASADLGGPDVPLTEWAEGLKRSGLAEFHRLKELGSEAKRRLASCMLPRSADGRLTERLVSDCGGSPGILVTVALHLASTGRIGAPNEASARALDSATAASPWSMEKIGGLLLATADGVAGKALRLLAVAGHDVGLSVLASAVGVVSSDLEQILRESPASWVFSFTESDVGTRCMLQHRALADAVACRIDPGELTSLHDELAEAFEKCPENGIGETAVSAALHRLQGALPHAAVGKAIEALGQLVGAGSEGDALRVAELALPHAAGREKVLLLQAIGDLTYGRGMLAEARGFFERALAADAVDVAARTRLTAKLAACCARSGDYRRAEELLGGPLASPGGSGPAVETELGWAKLSLAITCFYRARFEEARAGFESAANAGKERGDRYLTVSALRWLATTHLRLGAASDATAACQEASGLVRGIGRPDELGKVLATIGYAAMIQGQYTEAIAYLDEARGLLRESGFLDAAALALDNLGSVHQKLCAWAKAAACYGEALLLYNRLGYDYARMPVLINLGQVNTSRGWLETALAQLKDAVEAAPEEPYLRCHALLRIASAACFLGDMKGARNSALAALGIAEFSGLAAAQEIAWRVLGEAEVLAGQISSGQEHLGKALAVARERGSRERETVCLVRLAEAALASGDAASAASLAESACRCAKEVTSEGVRALAQCVWGKAALAQGRVTAAFPQLQSAAVVFEKLDVPSELTDAAYHLAQACVQTGKLRFASYYLRTALDRIEQVACQLRSVENRRTFFSDPRRKQVFDAVQAFGQRSMTWR